MSVKLLTENPLEFLSLRGGFTGSSESILVKIPHFWKSRVAVHIHLHEFDWYAKRWLARLLGDFKTKKIAENHKIYFKLKNAN